MRPRAQISAAGVIIVVLIAVLGFAAVSAKSPAPEVEAPTEDALPASLSARVAAASFSASLNPTIEDPSPTTASQVAASPRVDPGPEASTTTTTPTTTTEPLPTTTSTTTTAAPATTTTTAPPPTTTTTTEPPPTTTTTEPPATTTTTPPVPGGERDVEEWRTLVAEHFPAEMVDEALTVIDCESNGDPLAENPYSGAAGLFQFIPSTWAWASQGAGYGGASPFEPTANVASAAWVVKRSIDHGANPWAHWSCRP